MFTAVGKYHEIIIMIIIIQKISNYAETVLISLPVFIQQITMKVPIFKD